MQQAASAFSTFASKYLVKKAVVRAKGPISHTLLCGGNLNIPLDLSVSGEMCQAMANDIEKGIPLYVNELRTEYFAFFMDLDFYVSERLTAEQIAHFMKISTDCIARFYKDDNCIENQYLCIVTQADSKILCSTNFELEALIENTDELDRIKKSGTPSSNAIPIKEALASNTKYTYETVFILEDGTYFQNVKRDNDNLLKHGIHAVYPKVVVDDEQALYIREALIEMLNRSNVNINLCGRKWPDVIDNAVYVSSGLRMYGCIKCSKCTVCKDSPDERKECIKCNGVGKLDEGRPYVLHSVYNNGMFSSELFAYFQNNLVKLIKMTCIRRDINVVKNSPTWMKFPGCPEFGDSVMYVKEETKPTKLVSKYRFFKEDNNASKSWKKKKVDVRDPVQLEIITRTVQTRFTNKYANLCLNNAYRDDSKIFVSVTGEGAHWCLNLNPPRDHTSNSIWFQFDKKGCCSKCFCRKPDTHDRRNNTPCAQFSSQYKTLNSREQEKLFPITKTIKKK